jgi:hypothetical protein
MPYILLAAIILSGIYRIILIIGVKDYFIVENSRFSCYG